MKYACLLSFFVFTFLSVPSFAQGGDHYMNGKIEMGEQNYPQAAMFFKKALLTEPNNVVIYNALCLALFKLNKFEEADSFLTIALDKDSAYQTTYWNKGLCAAKQRNDSVAIIWYKQFIVIASSASANVSQAHWEIIQAYYRILITNGLSQTQLNDLRNQVSIFERMAPDSPELRVVHKLMDKLSPQNEGFKLKNNRFVLE
jgi:tetratricopeptide (TPR) repeat protein